MALQPAYPARMYLCPQEMFHMDKKKHISLHVHDSVLSSLAAASVPPIVPAPTVSSPFFIHPNMLSTYISSLSIANLV